MPRRDRPSYNEDTRSGQVGIGSSSARPIFPTTNVTGTDRSSDEGLYPSYITHTTNISNLHNTWTGLNYFKADVNFYKRLLSAGPIPWHDVQSRAYGAYGDDTHDDTTAINAAAAQAATNGGMLYFPKGVYKITDDLDITGSMIIGGTGTDSVIKQYTAGKATFTVTSSNVWIRDLALTGTGSASYSAGSRAVYAYGADASNYISNIACSNLVISSWLDSGIYLWFVKQFMVENCNIQGIAGHGIIGMSVLDGLIRGNYLENMTCKLTASNGYGIIMTKTVGATATHPTPKRVVMVDNIIRQCPWEGLDCHSGDHLTFSYNQIYNCLYGMVVGTANDGAGTYYPATNILVNGNLIDSEVSDGTARTGIEFASTAATAINTGTISNNIIKGHGSGFSSPAAEGYGGAIVAFRTRNLVIANNRLLNSSSSGIDLVRDNSNFTCNGNSIDDPFGFSAGAGAQDACWGIYAGTSGGNDGTISGNVISRGTFTVANGVYLDTATKGYGIAIASGTGNTVHMGHNWVEAVYPLTDTTHACTVTDAEAYATSAALSSGATYTFTNLIPAGTLVLGVTCRVTTLITGATSFEVGDGTDPDRWGHLIAVAANTTTSIADFTITSPVYYTMATSVVLTANGADFTAGVVKVIVHYMKLRHPVA